MKLAQTIYRVSLYHNNYDTQSRYFNDVEAAKDAAKNAEEFGGKTFIFFSNESIDGELWWERLNEATVNAV